MAHLADRCSLSLHEAYANPHPIRGCESGRVEGSFAKLHYDATTGDALP
jgi:hypothetical protein